MTTDGQGKVTLIAYSDLLGFGSMISNASGTLDSAVGKIALTRISKIRDSMIQCEKLFPKDTKFFHLNDLVMASLDVNVEIDSMPVDSESISVNAMSRDTWLNVVDFMPASASLHQSIIDSENTNQLGLT